MFAYSGISEADQPLALESLSVPYRQRPRLHSAAVAARRWLHGQISPPRLYLQQQQQQGPLKPCAQLPLLQPSGLKEGELRPTPRLHIRQPSQEQVATSTPFLIYTVRLICICAFGSRLYLMLC
jgi:hypothetical protein